MNRAERRRQGRQENLVITCTQCQMWFDTNDGWHADRAPIGFGLPICPACGAVLMQVPAASFYKQNEDMGRMEEVMTWEWPNGSFWKEPKP